MKKSSATHRDTRIKDSEVETPAPEVEPPKLWVVDLVVSMLANEGESDRQTFRVEARRITEAHRKALERASRNPRVMAVLEVSRPRLVE
jgi:hypothetical protein